MCEKVKVRTERASLERVSCAVLKDLCLLILKAVGLDEETQKSFEEEVPRCTVHFGNLGPTWEQLTRSASLQTGS